MTQSAKSAGSVSDADRRRFWIWGTPVIAFVAVMKGIRRPLDWAMTQAQVDYRFGLVKRGFFGAVVARPLHLEHSSLMTAVSLLIFALVVAVLLWAVMGRAVRTRFVTAEIVALFFSSYALTYLANMAGYLDLFEALLCVPAMLIRRPLQRFLVLLPVVAVSMLTHELFLFVFVPVLVLGFVLQWASRRAEARGTSELVEAGVLLAICGALAVMLTLQAPMSAARAEQFGESVARQADFPVRRDLFEVLSRSGADNVGLMREAARGHIWRRSQVVSVLTFGPTVAVLLAASVAVVRTSGVRWPGVMGVLCCGAGLSPQAMNVFGWDVGRWGALCTLSSVLVLVTVCRLTDGPAVALSRRLQASAVALVLLNLATGDMLIDDGHARAFPFFPVPQYHLRSNGATPAEGARQGPVSRNDNDVVMRWRLC